MSANGRLPRSQLLPAVNYEPLRGEPVGPLAGYLRADACHQWTVMDSHYHSITGGHLRLSEGYRDFGDQQNRWNIFEATGSPLAAWPGSSNHGWGLAADAGLEGRAWMLRNGPAFGWQPTGQAFSRPEPWHFDYVPATARITTPITSAAQRPTPPPAEDSHMIQLRDKKTGHIFTLGPSQVRHEVDMASADIVRNVVSSSDERHELNPSQVRAVFSSFGVPRKFVDAAVLDAIGGFWRASDSEQ